MRKILFLAGLVLILSGCSLIPGNTSRPVINSNNSVNNNEVTNTNTVDNSANTNSVENSVPAPTPTPSPSTGNGGITMAELAKHNKPSDCWLLISGKVYNASNIADNHPGGEMVYLGCGIDATNLYNTQGGEGRPHSSRADAGLQTLYIGDIIK